MERFTQESHGAESSALRGRELAALIERVARGDGDALMRLYDSTSGALFGLACRILRNDEPAEPALLDAYTDVWRQADAFDPRRWSALSWMAILAVSRAVDRFDADTQPAVDQEDLAASIGLDLVPIEPPAYLRDLLAARLEREPRTTPAPEPTPKDRKEEQALRMAAPLSPTGERRNPWPLRILAAVLALAALILLVSWQSAERALREQTDAATGARAEVERLRSSLEREEGRGSELQTIHEALAGEGSRVIRLSGLEPTPGASAAIFWDTERGRWVLSARLTPPAEGKVYQLWFVTPTQRVSAGLLEPGEGGRVFHVFDVPSGLDNISAAAITVEPAGGSTQPTTQAYLHGQR